MVQTTVIFRFLRQASMLAGLSFLLFACGERLPEGIVSQKKMTDILFDVHVADGMLANQPIDSARLQMVSLYEAVFQRHAIDSAAFRSNVEYYAAHPGVMKVMYEQLEARMNKLVEEGQEVINERYRLERERDSIRSARVSDSLRRIERLKLDVARKRHLLFLPEADSTYDAAVPVTFQTVRERMLEEMGFGEIYFGSLHNPVGTTAPPDTTATEQPAAGEQLMPAPEIPVTPPPSPPASLRKLSIDEPALQ